MATKEQYDILVGAYHEESVRYEALGRQASFYLSIVTFVSGGFFFKLEVVTTVAKASSLGFWSLVAVWSFLLLAFGSTLFSVFVRPFQTLFDPVEIGREVVNKQPTNSDFFDDRIVEVGVVTGRNVIENDKAAQWLQFAGWLIALSFAAASLFLFSSVYYPVEFKK
jgi:hypothetical protein